MVSRYRWALRPGWLLSHVFVGACVLAFVSLGLWQLRRLDERRTQNALIEGRRTEAPAPVDHVLTPASGPGDVDASIYRSVTATGIYRPEDQVLIRNQSYRGSPGYHVVTPLVLPGGQAVAVNRGWIPLTTGDAPDASAYAPPAGTVTLTGLVARTQTQAGMGAADPAAGRLTKLTRVDVARLQQQVGVPLLPAYLTLETQAPAAGEIPVAVPLPPLDDGPHLNYAGQWFIFAALTGIVYPLLLRRTAGHKAAEAAEAAAAGGSHVSDAAPDAATDLVPTSGRG